VLPQRLIAARWLAVASALCALAGCTSHPRPRLTSGPRAVSLHDVTTEIAVAIGAADRLVGASEPIELPAAIRAAVLHLPRAGGVESIVALQPTVVLGMEVVAQRSPDLVSHLRARGIDVWLGHPTTLDDVLGLVPAVGARLGVPAAAEALAARLRARVGPVVPAAGEPLRVFVYDCCDPPFTAARTAVLTDLIERAGGRNVFADVGADWTKVSWEAVVARRPQLVVIHDYDMDGQGDVAQKRRQLAAIPTLTGVPVMVLPLGFSLGGLRSVDGLERLRAAIAAVARGPG
jgi:iron complex transport system substrate-binding protein